MEDDNHDREDGAEAGNTTTEALACVSCRSRKLKCDRRIPICSRCAKVNGECVYPESRRKPTFKRRNVKELEARLGKKLYSPSTFIYLVFIFFALVISTLF